jgi:hypothetical protein
MTTNQPVDLGKVTDETRNPGLDIRDNPAAQHGDSTL